MQNHKFWKFTLNQLLFGGALSIIWSAIRGWNFALTDYAIFIVSFTISGLISKSVVDKFGNPAPVRTFVDNLHSVSGRNPIAILRQFANSNPMLAIGTPVVTLLYLFVPSEANSPVIAKQVYQAAVFLGFAWVGVNVVSESIATLMVPANPFIALIRFWQRSLIVVSASIFMRVFRNEIAGIVTWIASNPQDALTVVIGAAILRAAFYLIPLKTLNEQLRVQTTAQAIAIKPKARAAEDIRRTAIHEAGHLMYFADLPELPPELSVNVLEQITLEDKVRGQVNAGDLWPSPMTESHLQWLMYTHIAGSEAEFLILGDRADGSATDYAKWLTCANAYLESGFGEVFYQNPDNEAEREHNRSVLNTLKQQHLDTVRARLERNKGLLQELAERIAEQKTMTREEIAPFLALVN